jgi:hypothetical protein
MTALRRAHERLDCIEVNRIAELMDTPVAA